jgi:hypothetical protein
MGLKMFEPTRRRPRTPSRDPGGIRPRRGRESSSLLRSDRSPSLPNAIVRCAPMRRRTRRRQGAWVGQRASHTRQGRTASPTPWEVRSPSTCRADAHLRRPSLGHSRFEPLRWRLPIRRHRIWRLRPKRLPSKHWRDSSSPRNSGRTGLRPRRAGRLQDSRRRQLPMWRLAHRSEIPERVRHRDRAPRRLPPRRLRRWLMPQPIPSPTSQPRRRLRWRPSRRVVAQGRAARNSNRLPDWLPSPTASSPALLGRVDCRIVVGLGRAMWHNGAATLGSRHGGADGTQDLSAQVR